MLRQIDENVKLICEAIASVMAIDVTIVDKEMTRIAGTGRYSDTVGECLSAQSAFSYALKHNTGFIIENPGQHQACKQCDCKNKCSEHAEVCCPIRYEGQAVGVIGLIAFDPVQKQKLIENQINLMGFLDRMADLIATKLREVEGALKQKTLVRELETVFNSVESGLIAVDDKGYFIRLNPRAKKQINWSHNMDHIEDLFEPALIRRILATRHPIKNLLFSLKSGFKGIMDVNVTMVDGQVRGFVISFKGVDDLIDTANELMHDTQPTTFDSILGESGPIKDAIALARRVSQTSSTVLILGESGTGKELFARAIHQSSLRKNAPFIAINCSAIPEQLLESELFGYEEGAFTGAKKGGKLGKFKLANQGTLFLDEIGDMPIHLQAKLLRVLQEGAIEPIGGQTTIPVDVRVIAATHQDLESKVREGAFRQDLFYRLNVIPVTIPALNQRKSDIPKIVWAMVNRFNQRLGKTIGSIESECFDTLMAYTWPGNVRELENTIEYAVHMCDEGILKKKHLPRRIFIERDPQGIIQDEPIEIDHLIRPLDTLEKEAISRALDHYNGDKNKVANALKIGRATLYRKIEKYGL